MRYFCIGDEDTVVGFRLAGVQGQVARMAEDARTIFRSVTSLPEIGIVIITETLAGAIREDVDRLEKTGGFPLVVEIPDRHGPAVGRKTMAQIVRQVVGVKI